METRNSYKKFKIARTLITTNVSFSLTENNTLSNIPEG
jgi:hypothetical protein